MTDVSVMLWGREIGAISWLAERDLGVFQYAPEFAHSKYEISPLMMPLREEPYEFPALSRETFKGLPGLLADSLPDKFGNALIDMWLASQSRLPESFNPVERLCYIGNRGMGALEFKPALHRQTARDKKLKITKLVELANKVLDEREALAGTFSGIDDTAVIEDILRVGTSAGGARAKAVLAWNEKTDEFRSGQIPAAEGFSYWLMKFDGVLGNKDREVVDPQGYGLIEYAYYLMAVDCGITMTRCRLHRENGRAHFMTKRFDREDNGEKLHMLSLGAMMHFDFNQADAYSYEQALQTILRIGMPMADIEEQFRRTVFNVIARNHDDHVKNIAYLMDKEGTWRLSPAFDMAYSYNPTGAWTSRHQMSVNGKRDGFDFEDLLSLARSSGIKKHRATDIYNQVKDKVVKWEDYAEEATVDAATRQKIKIAHRRLT